MTKYNEVQMELFVEENGIHSDDVSQVIRQCSCCNYYVDVDNQSSEVVINGITHYDICDDCSDNLKGMVI